MIFEGSAFGFIYNDFFEIDLLSLLIDSTKPRVHRLYIKLRLSSKHSILNFSLGVFAIVTSKIKA
jgi:hypothetical protein